MISAEIDPTLGLISIALIGFLQAVTLAFIARNNLNTKRIKQQWEPNGGDSLHDRFNHLSETIFAINRRLRAGEKLAADKHNANKARIIRIENRLGLQDEPNKEGL